VKNKILLGLLSIFVVFLMAACGNGETQPNEESQSTETESRSEEEMDMESDSGGHMEHSADEMSSSGEVPEDLKEAENPTYEVGQLLKQNTCKVWMVLKQQFPVLLTRLSILSHTHLRMVETLSKIINGSSMKNWKVQEKHHWSPALK